MARVTYGSGVTELAGSIGGVTYQKNASGNIAKLRANPVVNPTSLQAKYQNVFSYLVSFWSTLSQANKDLWDAHALAHDHTTPWAEIKTLSGYQWFLTCNLRRMLYHTSAISSPGPWVAYAPPDQFIIEASATYLRVAWSPAYTPFHMLFYISLPLRQSSLKLRRSLFYVGYDVVGGARTTKVFTTQFENLANVTWADFYNSANCHIIIRILNGDVSTGYFSSYASAITKIN